MSNTDLVTPVEDYIAGRVLYDAIQYAELTKESAHVGTFIRNRMEREPLAHNALHKVVAWSDAIIAERDSMKAERDAALAELEKAKASEKVATGGPWGNHSTELLRLLAAASLKFWENHDPSEIDTAPKNKDVAGWLKDQNVASRVAEIMAQILRLDGLRTGPRT